MTIENVKKEDVIALKVEGRVDTTTAPMFEDEIKKNIEGIKELVIDLEKMDYISSAGLRVLLSAQKIMDKQGKMKVKNVNENIMDIFEITGFDTILTIE